ncbi:hypothetical protein FDH38_gp025 [Dinoroseobacter phage vB_DshS-R5C]|uniref:Uncharacterized protein n=1 Tax=Dinoroseobacter phage vB_DshS-R5C TaxID=1965368 RepID=A0A1V0DY54_9CAUD|nr:hypothetical protein FDH38_gp025 [Dinoroseobacter phage vB_DshS-R5C]ARB06079.1 hypothetical protein vBDshSR5C_25 [Dinoroseobacter phage vB_DshS-R5C]
MGGTITGRFTSSGPAWQELTREQVKVITFARRYGAGSAKLAQLSGLDPVETDFAAIEARVFQFVREGREDPYDVARAC